MKKFIGLLLVIILVVGGYFYGSPYLAINNMHTALEEQDFEKFNGYIDYAKVRQGLKEQINTAIMQQISQNSNNQFEQGAEVLGTMFASTMTDKLIDGMVTPEMTAKAIEQGKLNINNLNSIQSSFGKKSLPQTKQPLSTEPTTENNTDKTADFDYNTRYLSVNRFAVEVFHKQHADKKVTIIMKRDGLDWQVIRVKIPLDDLK